jgi:ubiquinone/menaquinone biosynthesis C-methylase UbiE
MISDALLARVRCPACRGDLAPAPAPDDARDVALACRQCGAVYPQHARDFLDLRPRAAFDEQTKYLDEALHQDARHESVSPPLLQSGVRQRQLRRFLRLAPGDRVIDLGCGSGRSMLWNAASGATFTGVDVSPFFAHEARATADLALADLRQLPFADGAFTKAYALDVLEHLSPEALDAMLAEAARVLAPGGVLFVYSHVRKNAPIARGLRAINALARVLERRGLIDMTQERLRKSDHVNPLRDVPHLETVVAKAGFRIARIRYYTPIVGGFVENILMRMAERALARRADRRRAARGTAAGAADGAAGLREARLGAKARLARGGPLVRVLQAVTIGMDADLWLFGRIRSGPFFALLEKR